MSKIDLPEISNIISFGGPATPPSSAAIKSVELLKERFRIDPVLQAGVLQGLTAVYGEKEAESMFLTMRTSQK